MNLRTILIVLFLSVVAAASAQTPIDYSVSGIGVGSTGDFAPYFIGSMNHGKTAQKGMAAVDAYIGRSLSTASRFSWGFGVEALAGYTSRNDYARYSASTSSWNENRQGPAAAWLQQLYGEVKYRGVFLSVGLKEYTSALLDSHLSSGDLVESGNARPIPEVRVGFVDFQNIPLTNGWVQIQGEISYGKMPDNKFMKNHFNYYDYHISLGALYSYKRCYFRTKPSQPFSVTVGMQVGAMFGGETSYYYNGKFQKTDKFSKSLKTFFNVFFPTQGNGELFYEGNSLGSWDLKARYRLASGAQISAYFQWPWEDGSGIGKLNGFDGVWGLEYRTSERSWLNALVVEYVDFRNQSGPIHWAPSDSPGTTITSQATGYDNYYNNAFYNSYANYGLSIGSPFLLSPLYNLDGYPAFISTRANGFHFGAEGSLTSTLDYRVLLSQQRALGTYRCPIYPAKKCFSAMLQATWDAARLLPGLSVDAKLAVDSGKLRGNNFGCALTLKYKGSFNFPKH